MSKRLGFTLIELLMVIAIISLLKAKEQAKAVVCRNHCKTLALSNAVYSQEWDRWLVCPGIRYYR